MAGSGSGGIGTPVFRSYPTGTVTEGDSLTWAWECGNGDVASCRFRIVQSGTGVVYTATVTQQTYGQWELTLVPSVIGLEAGNTFYALCEGYDGSQYGNVAQTPTFALEEAPVLTITSPTTNGHITAVPVYVTWTVDTSVGIRSQYARVWDSTGAQLVNSTVPRTERSVEMPASLIDESETYTVEVQVDTQYGTTVTARSTNVTVQWAAPNPATATFANDPDTLTTAITVHFGASGSGVPATESVTVSRDGFVLGTVGDGGTVTDTLPPLGAEYSYQLTSVSVNDTARTVDAANTFPTTQWALGASPSIPLRFNPQASWSLDHGGELYRFAGGGLPTFYGTTEYDESGTLQFDTVGKDKADAIAALLKSQPVQYLRDPFGHRWKAHVRPSVRHGVGSIWNVSLDWRAVRWAE